MKQSTQNVANNTKRNKDYKLLSYITTNNYKINNKTKNTTVKLVLPRSYKNKETNRQTNSGNL